MKWKKPNGRLKDINMADHRIDWDGDQDSEQSAQLADFLEPYWRHDMVYVQVPVAGTRMTYDYVNVTKKIICEFDGNQHDQYIKGFFHRNRQDYLSQIKRDILKDELANKNGYKMIRVKPADLPKLSAEWFLATWNITL